MPSPKGVPIELGGKRTLRFTTRSVVRLENETGRTFTEHFNLVRAKDSVASIIAMIWGGLLHEKPTITLDEVADLIDLGRVGEIGALATRAYLIAMGAEEKDDAAAEGGAADEAGKPE